ncbi:hypothetical protein PF008_g32720 [Phytophthora fragariae]|nr:hypothetical protein PF008_g32720 [Phytophthora fragariae]
MTREIYRDMLVNDVIPAIKAKSPQDQKHIPIRLQQDNAKPHVHEDDAEVLAAGCSDGWMMHPLNQPAQSPDLNCLELGYFASIQTLQSKTHPRTTVDLIKEVKLAFEETTAATPNKTFLSLQAVMEQIMRCGGSNNYKLGHMHKDKLLRAGTLPISLPCDVNVFLNARDAILQPVTASIPGTQEACDLDVFLW